MPWRRGSTRSTKRSSLPDDLAHPWRRPELKILLVSSSFYPKIDGSTRCVYDHARKLAERGNEVYLVTRGIEGMRQEETFEGIHVRRSKYAFRGGTFFDKIRLMLEQILMIVTLQRQERFSVIHAHGFTSGLAALPSRYMFGIPLIITTHGTELLWPRKLWWKTTREEEFTLIFEKYVLSLCDVIIAQSEGVKAYMLRIYGSKLEKKIRIVHTGVDEQKFMVTRKEGGAPEVLFVGALSEVKGLTCLLRAFKTVHDAIPQAGLTLVGSGPRAGEYKALVKSMELDGSVKFRGPVRDDARLLDVYRGCDIVVLPSNVGGPISCTILEGLSCGKAVISTNVPGGIPDVLGGGVGILMQPEDDVRLAFELKKLMTDPDYLRTLETNARRAVEERYTLDSMIDKLMRLYREVAA